MNVGSSSVARSHNQLMYDSAVKTASMAKDQMEQQGKDMLKLLDSTKINQSSHPTKGHNIDVSI